MQFEYNAPRKLGRRIRWKVNGEEKMTTPRKQSSAHCKANVMVEAIKGQKTINEPVCDRRVTRDYT